MRLGKNKCENPEDPCVRRGVKLEVEKGLIKA